MPDSRQKAHNKKHAKHEQATRPDKSGPERQPSVLPQEPLQKGDRERRV